MLNWKISLGVVCAFLSLFVVGCSNVLTMQEQVFVLISTDITSKDVILKKTTLTLCNNSLIPIFIPTEKNIVFFPESICFEFNRNDVIDSHTLDLNYNYREVHFSPTYYRLEPGCSVSGTFFWHSDFPSQFYNVLSDAEEIRARWDFYYKNSDNKYVMGVATSKWMSKKTFCDNVTVVKKDKDEFYVPSKKTKKINFQEEITIESSLD